MNVNDVMLKTFNLTNDPNGERQVGSLNDEMRKYYENMEGVDKDSFNVLKKLSYDEPRDTIIAEASVQTKPSSLYLGEEFRMSNGVQAVTFNLADGTKAVGIVNRYDEGGSYSNPKFFALWTRQSLMVNTNSSQIMEGPIEVSYTTAGDNLTVDFDVFPVEAGKLRVRFWIGTDDTGDLIFDEIRTFTQEEIDTNLPLKFMVGNPYLLEQGTQLFVRMEGVSLKGNGTLPYFVSYVNPYKEITINGHVEVTNQNLTLFIGCDYGVNTNNNAVVITVPPTFKDKFRVFDLTGYFNRYNCTVSFMQFNQGTVEMVNAWDDIEFFYIENDGWWLRDNVSGFVGKV